MLCPFCSHTEDSVVAGHTSRDQSVIRRRRGCLGCGKRYTTFERVEEQVRMVKKKDGRREEFLREKLMASLVRACEKRPITAGQVGTIVTAVEAYVRDSTERERPSSHIALFCIQRLKEIDPVAYIRYAAGHVQFQDVSDLTDYFRTLTLSMGKSASAIKRTLGAAEGRREEEVSMGEG